MYNKYRKNEKKGRRKVGSLYSKPDKKEDEKLAQYKPNKKRSKVGSLLDQKEQKLAHC
jgi:hypothetical protein